MSAAPHKTANVRERERERRFLRAAIVAGAGLVLITALVFGLRPSNDFTIRAQFASSTNLVPGSAVRIAGVDVGEVASIDPGPDHSSIVSMHVSKKALPLHADATFAIKPRLLLEGNFYVRVEPGSPAAPELRSGALIPPSRTSVPVQLDQVLTRFDEPTRSSLTASIKELARGLGDGGSAQAAPGSVPGYAGLRDAARELDRALGPVTGAARAARGTAPGDLSRMVRHTRDFAGQVGRSPAALRGLIDDYATVVGALAAEARPLRASITRLDDTLRIARPALAALDGALPTVTQFGDALNPALRAAPTPLRQISAILDQLDRVASKRELAGLLTDLRPVTATLPSFERQLTRLLPFVTKATTCLSKRVVPVLQTKLDDGKLSTGDPVWLDLLHAATGVTSGIGGFDGNGSAVRAGFTGGPTQFTGVFPGVGDVMGISPRITGVRPQWLGFNRITPFRPDVPCGSQALPKLGASPAGPPAWMHFGKAGSAAGDR